MTILRNGQVLPLHAVSTMDVHELREKVANATREKTSNGTVRISALFVYDKKLFAVLADEEQGLLELLSSPVNGSYPALTPVCPQAHWFEREIFEQGGPRPGLGGQGGDATAEHPWLKPIRANYEDFFGVVGNEIHEVAVGPVHAGIIEPGHFRFQCHGENVLNLEIALGYQHRGIENALQNAPDKRTAHLMEMAAGDTSVGHGIAYAHAVESLCGIRTSARAESLRAIALELERLANHTGDLGALANDVGYLPTASFCGRLRGDFLNITALICGNRFGRGLVRPGGTEFDLSPEIVRDILSRLDHTLRDVAGAVDLLWKSSSVMSRFENTGVISRETCIALGIVGPVARASGVERDVRHDFPNGIFNFAQVPVSTASAGDVFSRAFVRWLEIQRSAEFVRDQIKNLPSGAVLLEPGMLAANSICVSLVEGWRGEICHVAVTDARGKFARYKIIDPSFHNWFGLAVAMRGQQISDFPLCNKSFNLSYCGHDL